VGLAHEGVADDGDADGVRGHDACSFVVSERRNARPSVASRSCVGASGRQMDAAVAMLALSAVKLSMTSGPVYPTSSSAATRAGQSVWSPPGAPRSLPHTWTWTRCAPAARTASAEDRSSMLRWYVSSASPRFGPSRRSEEHTSELQSRENLVCRILLERKDY